MSSTALYPSDATDWKSASLPVPACQLSPSLSISLPLSLSLLLSLPLSLSLSLFPMHDE